MENIKLIHLNLDNIFVLRFDFDGSPHAINQVVAIYDISLEIIQAPLEVVDLFLEDQVLKDTCVSFNFKEKLALRRVFRNDVQILLQDTKLYHFPHPMRPPLLKIFLEGPMDSSKELRIRIELKIPRNHLLDHLRLPLLKKVSQMPILYLINEPYTLKLCKIILLALAQFNLYLCYLALDSAGVSDCVLELAIQFL